MLKSKLIVFRHNFYKVILPSSEKTVLPADAVYSPRDSRPPPPPARAAGSVLGVSGGGGAGGGGVTSRYSPGALQVRRAAVVLQPPTTV